MTGTELVHVVTVKLNGMPATAVAEVALVIFGGSHTRYVKAPLSVAVPPSVVTTTSAAPAVPGDVVAVIEVAESTSSVHGALPPISTEVTSVKLVPSMVMSV